jgi:hypothetical protein
MFSFIKDDLLGIKETELKEKYSFDYRDKHIKTMLYSLIIMMKIIYGNFQKQNYGILAQKVIQVLQRKISGPS